MTWQAECQSRGGAVTVMPKSADAPAGDYTYIPACRFDNGDGTSKYVDMRSWSETLADNEMLAEDQWNILLGNAVDFRDKVVSGVSWGIGTVVAVGLGLLLFLRERK